MPVHLKAAFAAIVCLCLPLTARASDLIVETEDCFHDEFATYDAWIETLRKRSPDFDPDKERMASREEFDRFKRDIDCQWMLYRSTDGLVVNGFMLAPARAREKAQKLPVIIYNRGGNGAYGVTVFGRLLDELAPLAARGYVVVGSQYRGLRSRMLGPKRDPGKDEFGGKDVDDVMALFGIIDSLPYADPKRIGLYGWSRGGMESFLVARRTSRVSAMVVGGPLLDLFDAMEFRPETRNLYQKLIPDFDTNSQAALEARSAIRWVDEVPKTMPILLLHGDADERAPVRQSIAMARRLTELDRPHELRVITGGDHSLSGHRDEVAEAVAAWYARFL